jgi:hypothetical protein
MNLPSLSRRTVLKSGALTAGAVTAGTALAQSPAHARPDTGVSVYAFPLTAVRLGSGRSRRTPPGPTPT